MMFCPCSPCLMLLYAMLCGLSAKSQYNPGIWVLNLTILMIFFNPSSLFTFCVCVCGRGGLLVYCEKINKCCAFQMMHL